MEQHLELYILHRLLSKKSNVVYPVLFHMLMRLINKIRSLLNRNRQHVIVVYLVMLLI